MELLKKVVLMFVTTLFLVTTVTAATEQLRVEMNEYVDQEVIFYPLTSSSTGIWYDTFENQSTYNLTGYINVSNQNAQGEPMSDIYILFENTGNITLPSLVSGRTGTWISNDVSSGTITLHIPEILAGEDSYWVYSINDTEIRPPLNLTSSYPVHKILAGDSINITDTIENVFDNMGFQGTCIFDINLTQTTTPINFSGTLYDFFFDNTSTSGSDASNVTYYNSNKTQEWDALGGGCLYKTNTTDINYLVGSPINIPTSDRYTVTNTTLKYSLNETISHLNVTDIKVISEANLSFEKQIVGPSDPILFGSNATWNVSGLFSTGTDITYNLTHFTLWVSQRNVNGSYTDPNTVANDTISNATLEVEYFPNVLVNASQTWTNPDWLFNYTDLPSPIVWMDVNFTIHDDGAQLIDRSVTQDGTDIYVKDLYLIIGYWLEIEKNISTIAQDTYHIRIDVHNKGNQVTPTGSIVTIYDFIPSNFNLNGSFVYSSSPWYNTSESNTTIYGPEYNGTLHQWALIPTNVFNTSLDKGPAKTENTTWSADFNVTGIGDYTLLDVFVTGLDPQKVEGAGSTRAVVVSEILDRIKSTEGIFAVVASILLLLGLLL